uniref:Uncharacterized protein n=1 Tax=Candidatus Methanogaster sp. ANME-2c ERB4 TaxID=2759911 RepID=A0A7G9YLD9_9EURY|nr:hypothetical protein IMBEDNDK_00033 [Methanosarcinales archaeon ANME-2c ERB4]
MKEVLVVDLLTKRDARKLSGKYAEIWYLYTDNVSFNNKIKSISEYKSKNPIFWQKEYLALQLCNKSYTTRLDKQLNHLHKNLNNIKLIYKKLQTNEYTSDFIMASVVKVFITNLIDGNEKKIAVTYKNNQFLCLHEYPEQVKVIRKIGIRTIIKKLAWLNAYFGYYLYNILKMKYKNIEGRPRKDYDILFYFDRKGQEIEWKYFLDKLSQNNKIAIYFHHRPRTKHIKDDLEEILTNVERGSNISKDDVFIDENFRYLNVKNKFHHLLKGFKNYITINFWLLADFRNIEYYTKYFLTELETIIYKNVLNEIDTKRFITIGEYEPDLNIRTTVWKSSGAITENVVHGLKQAIFEDSYIYLDRIYVWDDVMENEFRKMDCKIGEYIYSGPKYVHKVHDTPTWKSPISKKTIGIFSNDIESLDPTWAFGLANGEKFKNSFFEHVLFCAKNNPKYNFIVIPHPRERQRRYIIKKFDSELLKLPNVTIDFEGGRLGSFKYVRTLDLGITMQSSIGFEMLFSGFKCIFFDFNRNGYLYKYRQRYGEIFTNPDEFSIETWSDFVISKADQSKEEFFKQYSDIPIYGKNSLIDLILPNE